MSTIPRSHTIIHRFHRPLHNHEALSDFYDSFLSDLCEKLLRSEGQVEPIQEAIEDLFLALCEHRQQCSPAEWQSLIDRCRRHPICAMVHQDPFTYRAFSKPRGYAGDAVMMDYIYGREELWTPPTTTPLGASIFDFTTRAPASEGVRARRGFIADLLDNLSAERPRMQVLSVAAGHLREAAISSAVRRRKFSRFVALDADALSLDEIRRCYGGYGIETNLARVTRLIDARLELGQFDLIYSLGLFDYLAQRLGQRIIGRLFEMLRPGGRLVVANFLPTIRDIGYMEAFMDWRLIYRNRQEMLDLSDLIPQSEIKEIHLFAEENQNIMFLMLTKV